jgi:hypothetical protein
MVITYSSSDQLQDLVEIAVSPHVVIDCHDWYGADGEVKTRYFIRFAWEVIYSNHVYQSFNPSDVKRPGFGEGASR